MRSLDVAPQLTKKEQPSCLYSVWKTNWNLESIKVLLKSALLVCTRFICAKTETPVSFSYFFSLGTRRNDNLLPEVLTPGGILQISSDRRSLTRWQGWSEDFFCVGKFWQVFFWVVNLSREFFGYSKQSEDSCSSRVSRPLSSSGNFRARKFGMGFFRA